MAYEKRSCINLASWRLGDTQWANHRGSSLNVLRDLGGGSMTLVLQALNLSFLDCRIKGLDDLNVLPPPHTHL